MDNSKSNKSAAPQANGASAPSGDSELGRLILEQKLATPEEIDECLKLKADRGATDSNVTLFQILVEKGVVTQSQMRRMKTSIEDARKSQQIPGYRIEAKLGAGGMAVVFKARQLSLDRLVAIKVLPKKLSENADYVARFYKEGKAAAKLNHPNIVQAIDVGEANGYHYFVMEYVEGKTLYDDLAAGKVLGEAEALRITIQIAKALEHAHSQGLIHRDVKPKNIMLTKEGVAKLADMGLARAVTDDQAAQAEAGRAFGTPYYISPEQIRGEMNIDFRADIYSLGATLYHMVTGKVPFEAATPAAVMHKHLREPLVPPDHLNPNLSAGLGEVVEVMMAKDKRRRYASTKDLLLDLEAIAAGRPPLQARNQISSGVLSGLESEGQPPNPQLEDTYVSPKVANQTLLLVILGAALGISVIVNIIQLLRH
jgi:serine/threonine-protein kinase